LKTKHLLLALLTVFIWGINFIAIHAALKNIPPFLLCALRFGLAAFPLVFFLPKPKAPIKYILGYGIFTFALQFGFLFSGIHLGLPPGLSSLVLQVQVFFSMGMAALFFQDKATKWKIIAALISFIGLWIVGSHVDGSGTFIGFLLTLLAAVSWAAGNMFSKKVAASSPLALVAWGNLIAFPFMLAYSYFMEGPALIASSIENISLETVIAVVYIVYLSTFVGYGIWGYLLNSYATAVVVPFTLLVPVFGILSAVVWLGEGLPLWKFIACTFIMLGLIFNLFENQIKRIVSKFIK
jgi:O-acetylserine/cysteine efflux transporter